MQIRDIKNVIFDLGGVIINLSEDKTLASFSQLCGWNVEQLRAELLLSDFYKRFERGELTGSEFRKEVRDLLEIESSDDQINHAMNAMLLDIPKERIDLLRQLRHRFRLFLLSNTNAIHFSAFNQIIEKTTGEHRIDGYFEKAYYSHLVNMRKPDKDIYQLVINENKLNPRETLFLDDNAANLEGAAALGIQTTQVTDSSIIFNVFK